MKYTMLLSLLTCAAYTSSLVCMADANSSTVTSPTAQTAKTANQAARLIQSPKGLVPIDNHSVKPPKTKSKQDKWDDKKKAIFGNKGKKGKKGKKIKFN